MTHALSLCLTSLSKPRVFQGYCSSIRLHIHGIMIERNEHYNWSLDSSSDLVQQCDLGHFLNSYTLFNSLKLPKIPTARDYGILHLTWIRKFTHIIYKEKEKPACSGHSWISLGCLSG